MCNTRCTTSRVTGVVYEIKSGRKPTGPPRAGRRPPPSGLRPSAPAASPVGFRRGNEWRPGRTLSANIIQRTLPFLREISIEGLFGLYDHQIELRPSAVTL